MSGIIVQLRNATADDADAILALWKAADATPSATDDVDAISRAAARPEVAFILAVEDGAVVGSIIAGFDGWRGNIYRLATHPAHRRRGVARALLARAEEMLAGWGVRRVTSLVENAHPDAVGFWRSVGYLDDKRISRYVRTLRALPVFVALAGCALALVTACSGSSSRNPRYPRRSPGCALSVHHGLPEVPVWDDIGVAQVDCYLDESEIACLGRLRTEACRMGGDIIYNVPAKASRPIERGMMYRAQVAHTRANKKKDDEPVPDAGAGPVVPIPSAWTIPPPPLPADAGGQ